MTNKDKVDTAIVLQGGGALGAYEYGVLKALYDKRPGFTPVALTGISIGAVTAAVLGGATGDPIEALDKMSRKFTVSVGVPLPKLIDRSLAALSDPGMYRLDTKQVMQMLMAPWTLTNVSDIAPLRQTLKELVDLDKLNGETSRVVVGATNIETAEIEFFDHRRPGGLTFEHVAAPAARFPDDRDRRRDVLGRRAVLQHAVEPAINALEEAAGGYPAAIREVIVIELFPMNAPVPRSLFDVLQRMVQLQYTSRLKLDKHFFDKVDGFVDLVAMLEKTLPKASPVRADSIYRELLTYRKINHFNVVTSTSSANLTTAATCPAPRSTNASKPATTDAIAQGIGDVDAPGLRFDVTFP